MSKTDSADNFITSLKLIDDEGRIKFIKQEVAIQTQSVAQSYDGRLYCPLARSVSGHRLYRKDVKTARPAVGRRNSKPSTMASCAPTQNPQVQTCVDPGTEINCTEGLEARHEAGRTLYEEAVSTENGASLPLITQMMINDRNVKAKRTTQSSDQTFENATRPARDKLDQESANASRLAPRVRAFAEFLGTSKGSTRKGLLLSFLHAFDFGKETQNDSPRPVDRFSTPDGRSLRSQRQREGHVKGKKAQSPKRSSSTRSSSKRRSPRSPRSNVKGRPSSPKNEHYVIYRRPSVRQEVVQQHNRNGVFGECETKMRSLLSLLHSRKSPPQYSETGAAGSEVDRHPDDSPCSVARVRIGNRRYRKCFRVAPSRFKIEYLQGLATEDTMPNRWK